MTKCLSIAKQINLTAKANCEGALLTLLQNMVSLSLKEVGCIRYELYQINDRLASFFLLEIWENSDALDAHKRSAHFIDFVSQMPNLVEDKSSIALNAF